MKKESVIVVSKLRRLFAPLCAALFLAACSGGEDEEASASPSADVATVIPAASASADAPTPSPMPTPEAGPTASPTPAFVDNIDLSGAVTVVFSGDSLSLRPMTLLDAGWRESGRSNKRIDGQVAHIDNFGTTWFIAFDEAPADRLALMTHQAITDVYTCPPDYPDAVDLCVDESGFYWIEQGGDRYRLMFMKSVREEPIVLKEGTCATIPSISAPGDNRPVFYCAEERVILLIDDTGVGWLDLAPAVYTPQVLPPEVVNDHLAWVEETSRGWAAVTLNIATGEQRVFLLQGISRPAKVTFDGELLLALSEQATLVAYCPADDVSIYISGSVRHYQHVVGGALISVNTATQSQAGRWIYRGDTPETDQALLPLLALQEGTILKTFHDSTELDSEMFLIRQEGHYEQMVVAIQKVQ